MVASLLLGSAKPVSPACGCLTCYSNYIIIGTGTCTLQLHLNTCTSLHYSLEALSGFVSICQTSQPSLQLALPVINLHVAIVTLLQLSKYKWFYVHLHQRNYCVILHNQCYYWMCVCVGDHYIHMWPVIKLAILA